MFSRPSACLLRSANSALSIITSSATSVSRQQCRNYAKNKSPKIPKIVRDGEKKGKTVKEMPAYRHNALKEEPYEPEDPEEWVPYYLRDTQEKPIDEDFELVDPEILDRKFKQLRLAQLKATDTKDSAPSSFFDDPNIVGKDDDLSLDDRTSKPKPSQSQPKSNLPNGPSFKLSDRSLEEEDTFRIQDSDIKRPRIRAIETETSPSWVDHSAPPEGYETPIYKRRKASAPTRPLFWQDPELPKPEEIDIEIYGLTRHHVPNDLSAALGKHYLARNLEPTPKARRRMGALFGNPPHRYPCFSLPVIAAARLGMEKELGHAFYVHFVYVPHCPYTFLSDEAGAKIVGPTFRQGGGHEVYVSGRKVACYPGGAKTLTSNWNILGADYFYHNPGKLTVDYLTEKVQLNFQKAEAVEKARRR